MQILQDKLVVRQLLDDLSETLSLHTHGLVRAMAAATTLIGRLRAIRLGFILNLDALQLLDGCFCRANLRLKCTFLESGVAATTLGRNIANNSDRLSLFLAEEPELTKLLLLQALNLGQIRTRLLLFLL